MSKQTAQASVAKHEATRDNQAQAQATATDARGNTSKSKESQSTTKTSGSYFTGTEWAFYATIIVVGLILRWTLLDMRPYHHDESLHGMYGRYFYDFPNANF
jgi:hypothetical protein